jgi:hypothetical protein
MSASAFHYRCLIPVVCALCRGPLQIRWLTLWTLRASVSASSGWVSPRLPTCPSASCSIHTYRHTRSRSGMHTHACTHICMRGNSVTELRRRKRAAHCCAPKSSCVRAFIVPAMQSEACAVSATPQQIRVHRVPARFHSTVLRFGSVLPSRA